MRAIAVIPARYQSSRFPGKPLAKIAGKPLLQWVVEAAQQCQKLEKVIVATDHGQIFEFAEKLGVEAVMTSPDLPSGSDRVNAAVLNESADVIVNIQGDEPLLRGELLDELIAPHVEDVNLEISTLATSLKIEEMIDKNVVKVVLDKNQNALYFSRFPVPYSRVDAKLPVKGCLKHVGLYAYKKSVLKEFCDQPPVELEQAESLEQLRALYLGAKIRVVSVDCDLHGVDTPEDVKRVEAILANKESHGS